MELIADLEIKRETAVMKFNLYMAANNWVALDELINNHLNTFPKFERNMVRAAGVLSTFKQAEETKKYDILNESKDKFEGDTRANMILAQAARLHGMNDMAVHFFTTGLTALDNSDANFVERVSAASESLDRNNPGAAANILFGHVALNRDTPELRMLANAMAFDVPIRNRAKRFFEEITPEIQALPTYQRLEGIYQTNRGTPIKAVALFEAAFKADPHMVNLMDLIGVYHRTDDQKAVLALLRNQSLDQLPGHPADRMNFCHVLSNNGEVSRAISLGYKTLIQHADRADAVMKYCGLFLTLKSEIPIKDDGKASDGKWIKLTCKDGREFTGIIGEDADRRWGIRADPTNEIVAAAIGLVVGESFNRMAPMGISETWTVTEIKPNWLQAFHYFSNSFGQHFPTVSGMARFNVADGDVEPIKEQVRQYSEAKRERANLYLEHSLPMAIVATGQPGGAIAFAEYLPTIGEEVRTCLGSVPEREEALNLIASNQEKGAVLDALTAWRAAELGVFDALKNKLGPLAIPSTELDFIKTIIDQMGDGADGLRMTMSYHNGQYYRDVVTEDEAKKKLCILRGRLRLIENSCSVEPVVIPDQLSEIGESLLTLSNNNVLAPAILAGDSRLFLSDDMYMRQLANFAVNTTGVWLQAVLLSAFNDNAMTLDAYSDALVLLAAHKHGYVSLDVTQLFSVFHSETSKELAKLQALCAYVGSKNAEPQSHIKLAALFINKIWVDSPKSDLKKYKATSIILRALLTRYRKSEWEHWAAALLSNLEYGAQRYFWDWCQGHFLLTSEIKTVLQKTIGQN
jgi:hypothetical protein